MEMRCSKVFFPNYSRKKPAEDTLVPPLWGTREKIVFLRVFVHAAVSGGTCAFTLKIVKPLIKDSSRDDRSRHRSNPRRTGSCRARPVNVDDGLEDIRWMRGLGGEKLPAASYALLPNLKKGLFLPSERDREFFVACFLHSSAQMCLYQTPGRRPPPITGRCEHCVTRGWVGAPAERAPFRFHGAVVGFVDRCLSRTRHLATSS